MNKIYSQDTHINIIVVVLFVIGLFMIWFRGDIIQGFKNEETIIENIDTNSTLVQTTLDQNTVEAGQIWLSETDNPFNEDIYWYIIETKKGYVKFTSVEYNKNKDLWIIPEQISYGTSNKISIFTAIYKRVK